MRFIELDLKVVERIYFSPKKGIYHLDIYIYISHPPCFGVRSLVERVVFRSVYSFSFFFYMGFLSRTFTNHRNAGEWGGHFFISSLPLPPASQTLDISLAIAAGSSPLQIASSPTQVGNLWFLRASR